MNKRKIFHAAGVLAAKAIEAALDAQSLRPVPREPRP